MCLLWVSACVLHGAWAYSDEGGDPSTTLLLSHGISLCRTPFSDPWTSHEVEEISHMVEGLPKALQWESAGKPIRFIKNSRMIALGYETALSPPNCPGRPPSSTHHIRDKYDLPVRAQVLYALLKHYDDEKHISAKKQWLTINEWEPVPILGRFLPERFNRPRNRSKKSVVFSFGKKSPQHDFLAAALCFFMPVLTSPQDSLKCLHPEKYRFMATCFPDYLWEGEGRPCKPMEEGFLDDLVFLNPDTGEEINIGPVTTDTVTGFEILYATPGTGDVSEIAGHLVLRIKLDNNSTAKKKGMENPRDLVISFLADTEPGERTFSVMEKDLPVQPECKKNWLNLVNNNVNDEPPLESIIQSIKGLSGGFLTTMDRQTLLYTIKSYTIEQGRDLLRYKLNVTDDQKKDLLERLFISRRNYQAGYYFFSQNCASVLVHVIGRGVGDRDLIDFNPLVSPPNTLISLMVRKHLAEPVYPSFYSYRKKGYIAQEMLKHELARLSITYPHVGWPRVFRLISRHEDTRFAATGELGDIAHAYPETARHVYKLSVMIQEAEMAYSYKDLRCENYTSAATAEARRIQKEVLSASAIRIDHIAMDANRAMAAFFSEKEKGSMAKGTSHTGHYRFGTGAGFRETSRSPNRSVMVVEGALHHQPMGSRSNLAMQRSSHVDFFATSLMVDMAENTFLNLTFTGLKLEKFRDRLNRVPSFYEPTGSFGLGLTLLDVAHERGSRGLYGTYAGIYGLLSLFSNPDNDRYVYLSAGAHVAGGHHDSLLQNDPQPHGPVTGIGLPLKASALVTLDDNRRWQLRSGLAYTFATADHALDDYRFNASLSCLIGEWRRADVIIKLSVTDHALFHAPSFSDSYHERTGTFLVEVNPW